MWVYCCLLGCLVILADLFGLLSLRFLIGSLWLLVARLRLVVFDFGLFIMICLLVCRFCV